MSKSTFLTHLIHLDPLIEQWGLELEAESGMAVATNTPVSIEIVEQDVMTFADMGHPVRYLQIRYVAMEKEQA